MSDQKSDRISDRISDRGTRLVARLDRDNDGKLSTGELQDTRLGKKMSVDRFARLDKNGDGLLEAGELNRKGGHHKAGHDDGPGQVERAMVAKFADLLAQKTTPADLGEDIAKAVLARLDKDDSGGLNSEEIAGTRLAEAIGAGFYELDSDKNGALDTGELSAFITSELLGSALASETDDSGDDHNEGDESDEHDVGTDPLASASAGPVATNDAVTGVAPADDTAQPVAVGTTETTETTKTTAATGAAGATETRATPEPVSSGPVQASYAEQVLSSFEAALALLQQGSRQQQATLEMARTLYTEARGTLGTA